MSSLDHNESVTTRSNRNLTSASTKPAPSEGVGSSRFQTTRWSVILEAGRTGSVGALDALEQLCRVYQFPVYAELRRRGYDPSTTQDLAQGFFESLLSGKFFGRADPQRGRFRSYLLTALRNYLADVEKGLGTQRRGGGVTSVALDALEAEARYRLEPSDSSSPAVLYERRFVLALLDQVMQRLEREFAVFGSSTLFHRLQDYLADDSTEAVTYAELGAELGMSVDALKSAMYRLRRRYREVLRDEIRQVVASEDEVEAELRYLFQVLAG